MKKYFIMALVVLFIVMVAHSALAAMDVERGILIKKLYTNNAELLVKLIECEIAGIDQKLESLNLVMSVRTDIKKAMVITERMQTSLKKTNITLKKDDSEVNSNVTPSDSEFNLSRVNETIQNLHEQRKNKLKELKEARQYLKEAKSFQ